MTRRIVYDPKTDAIVFGFNATVDFTEADWARLALAALDQAGLTQVRQRHVREIVEEQLNLESSR